MIKWDDKSIASWLENFDDLNYPTSVYHELVIEGKEPQNRFLIMGAWKTGSLRKGVNGDVYVDRSGNQYEFTNRWKPDAPVGYNVWQYVTAHQEFIRAQIPARFTNEEPEIAQYLRAKPGFGFVWTLFVLHCFYPEVYPLYDQHVYRAYCFITTDGQNVPAIASGRWSDYATYRDFFYNKLNETGATYWELDRALWAYGKSIKLKNNSNTIKPINKPVEIMSKDSFTKTPDRFVGWCHDLTLGGKSKKFWWRLDADSSLSIGRQFEGANFNSFKITIENLTAIQNYVQKTGWTDLANSVSKMGDKTEKEGLGKFLHEELGWNITNAQLASQLAALFVHAGIWTSNGYKRGIQIKNQSNNWYADLEAFYTKCYEPE